jgi:hypothetical protein
MHHCHEYVGLKLLPPIRLQGMIRDHKGNCTFTSTHIVVYSFHMQPEQGEQHNEIVPQVWFTDTYGSVTLCLPVGGGGGGGGGRRRINPRI